MDVVERVAPLRERLAHYRRNGESIGLVPTMGALHDGHLALVDRAAAECDRVVVSVFVNPTQFAPDEDFESYPRTLENDLAQLRARGIDSVFFPPVAEMYPEAAQTAVAVAPLGDILIGAQRPGHFRGVATVVSKLFNIVQPDSAYFGEKDYQQLLLIRRMVTDMLVPVSVVGVPTVRAADGLALSSRNARLAPADRTAASVLAKALDRGQAAIESGESDVGGLVEALRDLVAAEPRAALRSLDIRRADDLAPVETMGEAPVVILVTAGFGDVVLIDQRVAEPGRAAWPSGVAA